MKGKYVPRQKRYFLFIALFPQVTCDTTRGNGLRLQQGRFKMDVKKHFFTEKIMRHWNRPLREVVIELLSLEVFKSHICMVLGDKS